MGILARLLESETAKTERLAIAAKKEAEREVPGKLREAIKNGDRALVETLLADSLSADASTSDIWQTAIHAAAFYDQVAIAELIMSVKPDIDIDSALYGESLLQRAAYSGAATMVEWLLAHGANVNYVNREWLTPLHFLFAGPRGTWYGEVFCWDKQRWTADAPLAFEVLLKNGADVNARSISGQTPQDYAGRDLFSQVQHAGTKVLAGVLTKGVRGLKDPSYFQCQECRKRVLHQRADDARIGPVWVCPSCGHQVIRNWGA